MSFRRCPRGMERLAVGVWYCLSVRAETSGGDETIHPDILGWAANEPVSKAKFCRIGAYLHTFVFEVLERVVSDF